MCVADLIPANVSRVNLSDVNLLNSDLTGVILSNAVYDYRTKWPEGFGPDE